jgi:Asp-tRNA(Asn)/Glu-tRNA(Gln) amidotransferase B subunit
MEQGLDQLLHHLELQVVVAHQVPLEYTLVEEETMALQEAQVLLVVFLEELVQHQVAAAQDFWLLDNLFLAQLEEQAAAAAAAQVQEQQLAVLAGLVAF